MPQVKPSFPRLDRSHPLAQGLIACWPITSGFGNKVYDVSGNDITGTFAGTGVTWTGGNNGAALAFDSTASATVSFGTALKTDAVTALSVSVWVYIDTSLVSRGIIGRYDTAQRNWLVLTGNATTIRFYPAVNLTDAFTTHGDTAAGTCPNKTWTHVVFVFDGTGAANATRLLGYINGAKVALTFTGTVPASLTTSTSTTQMGFVTANQPFTGNIGATYIYNRVLSQQEIAMLYSQGY